MNFFTDEKFLIPFLATLGASSTILLLQFINKDRINKNKKFYACNYMLDVCYRILYSGLILKKHTIVPHIDAVQRMIKGDKKLLETTFLADEFDILTDQPFDFNLLPEEYKVLVGCDDINLIQSYETMIYLVKNERTRRTLNEFVKNNLKSVHFFENQNADKQIDILNTYWDYLDKIQHETDRVISSAIELVIPFIKKYIYKRQFLFFSKRNVNKLIAWETSILDNYKNILPEKEYWKKFISGGIQRAL